MEAQNTILVFGDAHASLTYLTDILSAAGYLVVPADSTDVLRLLQAHAETRDVPVILIRAAAALTEQPAEWMLAANIITAPFAPADLLARVRTRIELHRLHRQVAHYSAAVIASELRYRRLFESAKDGILILDAETGMIVDVNPFLIELLGYSRETFLGKKVWDPGFFRNIFANQAHFAELQQKGYVRYEDLPLETSDGRKVNVEFVSNVYLVDHQKVIQCNIRDITARVQGEVAHATLQSQYAQAQKMESVGRLAGGVAHDFNNTLMGMMGYAELCRDGIAPGHPICEWLNEIILTGTRSAKLARQLLAFARMEIISPRALDINDSISSMLKLLQRLIGEDIAINWRPGPVTWPVRMDPSQVDQILVNLTVNARDAIGGVGSIVIETSNTVIDPSHPSGHLEARPGDYVLLTFSDTGCGMDPETLEHIFEPFFTTKSRDRGTGLGLATVYGIVKQNNGSINVTSTPGKGTTFHVCLPRCMAVTTAPVAVQTAESPPVAMRPSCWSRTKSLSASPRISSLRIWATPCWSPRTRKRPCACSRDTPARFIS